MGTCSSLSSKTKVVTLTSDSLTKYPRRASLRVRVRNSLGKPIGAQKLDFPLTEPRLSKSKTVILRHRSYKISSIFHIVCVLPGLDPRGEGYKPCQDHCFFTATEDSFLLGLYDGHGKEGAKVVDFCVKTASNYYRHHKPSEVNSSHPLTFLLNLTHLCDEQLKKPDSNINVQNSGCTQVLILLKNDTLYSASVGDSRAILGTSEIPDILPAPIAHIKDDLDILSQVRRIRTPRIQTCLRSLQLTRDQKPDDPEELLRIIKLGGKVLQMVDEQGNPVGPFRVWKENEACPGLAMSRSIGDMIGAEVGVISTPICTSHELRTCDKFLVIASDGVWDVMENEEVVQFVEMYRKQCVDSTDLPALNQQKIQPNNASIAQLLCEEARTRWFSIVEEEDTMIDDISCIILEAEDLENHEYKENSTGLIKMDGNTECRGSESNLFFKTLGSPALSARVS